MFNLIPETPLVLYTARAGNGAKNLRSAPRSMPLSEKLCRLPTGDTAECHSALRSNAALSPGQCQDAPASMDNWKNFVTSEVL